MSSMDQQFQKVIKSASTVEQRKSAAAQGQDIRPWLNFSDITQAGKFDFTALASIFTRANVNSTYVTDKTTSTTALVKQVQGLKIAGDVLAGFERDTRMRNRSRIRSFAHTGARSKANGQTTGPLTVNSIGYLTRLLNEQEDNSEDANEV